MWTAKHPLAARRAHMRRRTSRVAVIIGLPLAALYFLLAVPAHAQSPMIQGWMAVNAECKGGVPDDPKTRKACARRDDLSAKLKRRGCLYQEDGDWWKCPHR